MTIKKKHKGKQKDVKHLKRDKKQPQRDANQKTMQCKTTTNHHAAMLFVVFLHVFQSGGCRAFLMSASTGPLSPNLSMALALQIADIWYYYFILENKEN